MAARSENPTHLNLLRWVPWRVAPMQITPAHAIYEQALVVNLVHFTNALQLLGELGIRTITNPTIRDLPKVQNGVAQITRAIAICGDNFQHLPVPPMGGEEADHCFRELGAVMVDLSGALKKLGDPKSSADHSQDQKFLLTLVQRLKQLSRQGLELYEAVFPGRLKTVFEILD